MSDGRVQDDHLGHHVGAVINLKVGGLRVELGIDSESTRLALVHALTGSGRHTVSVDATIRPVRLPPSAKSKVSVETVGARRVYRLTEAGLDSAASVV